MSLQILPFMLFKNKNEKEHAYISLATFLFFLLKYITKDY